MGERPCDHAEMLWGLCDSEGASDSVHRRVRGLSCCATEMGTHSSYCAAGSLVRRMAVGAAMRG